MRAALHREEMHGGDADGACSPPLTASGELDAETSEHLRELLRSFRERFFPTRSTNSPQTGP